MPRFAALLRGVNVGQANRVPMAEFRALLEALGYGDVRTLLNSGNAIFTGITRAPRVHADRIRAELAARLGVDVPVIVKSAKEVAAIASENALAGTVTDPSRLLVAFTSDARALEGLEPIAALVKSPERLHFGAHAAYLWCPNGFLQSKAGAALLGRQGRAATTRNWATVLKISALLSKDGI
jgi:uncharacterized protein (DUF1697 family)